jgi:hypothetical protein
MSETNARGGATGRLLVLLLVALPQSEVWALLPMALPPGCFYLTPLIFYTIPFVFASTVFMFFSF